MYNIYKEMCGKITFPKIRPEVVHTRESAERTGREAKLWRSIKLLQ